MRTLPLLILGSLVLAVACNDAPEPSTGVFVGPAPRLPESKAGSELDAAASAASGATISGYVETDDGQPIIGRPIAVVDARGARREILSDEGGTFHVLDVVLPYDLVVAGAPSGDIRTPTIFLGLTRTDPFVELFERDGPTMRPPAQTLRFAVKPPPCTGPASCFVSVASGSVSGSGACAIAYHDEGNIAFDLDHEWIAPVSAKDSITLHVLAYDGFRSSFAHAQVDGIRAEAGEVTELGILEPATVPGSSPLVVSAVARGAAAAWTPSVATWIDFPGNVTMSFSYESVREETIRVPVIPGASLRANAWMQHPAVPDRPQFHSAVQAWSGAQPIAASGGTLSLELPAAPVPVRPEMDGTLSAGGLGFAWTNPKSTPAPLTELTVARVDSGALRYRIWTIGDEAPFARLASLGLSPLAPGDHVLGITSSPGDVLDDLVHPDASTRHARSDPRRRGATSYQRFRFQVTR